MPLAYAYPSAQSPWKNYGAIITATGNDTTATVNSNVIDNVDGSIRRVAVQLACTDKTGTSPTITMTLQGSADGTNFVNVLNSSGNAIATTAIAISSAGGGTTVQGSLDTNSQGVTRFWPKLRVQLTLGGTSPGWTGNVFMDIDRPKQPIFAG